MAETERHSVIAAVTELLPTFRQRAQEAEDRRVLPAESVKALAETGFFRMLQPTGFGGLEATHPVDPHALAMSRTAA